jgi:hypothetical protein
MHEWLGTIMHALTTHLLAGYTYGTTTGDDVPPDHAALGPYQREYLHDVQVHDMGVYRCAFCTG